MSFIHTLVLCAALNAAPVCENGVCIDDFGVQSHSHVTVRSERPVLRAAASPFRLFARFRDRVADRRAGRGGIFCRSCH